MTDIFGSEHPMVQSTKPFALTMGDPAGIGPEIIVRFFEQRPDANAIVIGDLGVMQRAISGLGSALRVRSLSTIEAFATQPHDVRQFFVLPSSELSPLPHLGKVDAAAGRAAYDAIIQATDLAIRGEIAGVITAPIHKEALSAAGIKFPGHTEILAERCKTSHFGMMLADDHLRVVLVSIHVSLREAIERVTQENVCRTIALADQGARALGIENPRIAVAGLNPHAGEGGLFGREEIDIIAPAVNAMKNKGFFVSGPYAPDTVFMRARQGEFDIVVAQYHDQGLIPVKYLGVDGGVNVTVGLPIIRTSPDHGTAFDIAGKGIADPASLMKAYDVACAMAHARPS